MENIIAFLAKDWETTRNHINIFLGLMDKFLKKIFDHIVYLCALIWNLIYRIRSTAALLARKLRYIVRMVAILILVGASIYLEKSFGEHLTVHFKDPSSLDDLKTVIGILGGSLIGATAIAFSLIMFAMQVNVERMPYGLFRRLSSDIKLLSAFIITFLIAISIALLALIPNESWAAIAILFSVMGSILIIIMFVYSYRRALDLISPTKQLEIIAQSTKKDLIFWKKFTDRLSPLIKVEDQEDLSRADKRNLQRRIFQNSIKNWTNSADQNIEYCISYARSYAEKGDHEVSRVALNTIVLINRHYVAAKGNTFSSQNYLVPNPLANDAFINNTLEHLRQNVQLGISRGDEQQIEQTFRTFYQLCGAYALINHSSKYAPKHLAHLAAGYLANAVESVFPHQLSDVLIEGISLLGDSARILIAYDNPVQIAGISERIGVFGAVAARVEKFSPITQIAVKQLARMTNNLMFSKHHDIEYAAEEIRGDVKFIAKACLNTPDKSPYSYHSANFQYYYSATIGDSLCNTLTNLVNQLSNANKDNKEAQRIVSHLKQWSDDLYKTDKELLLLAIEKKSFLAFDLIHWICHITKLLLAASNANACDQHDKDELRKNAHWLISTLSFVPNDPESVNFVENYKMTDNLVESALDAHNRDCPEIANSIREMLLDWTFKAGPHGRGWGIFERGLCGLAAVNLKFGLENLVLITAIKNKLENNSTLDLDSKFRIAEDVRKQAQKAHRDTSSSEIDSILSSVDPKKLRKLLNEIADLFFPEKS